MKILVICEHGNVRSVALAYLIKTIYKHEAIAVGKKNLSNDTFRMLYEWADKRIWLLDKPIKFEGLRDITIDIGEDVWHNPYAQGLQHKLLKHIKELDL